MEVFSRMLKRVEGAGLLRGFKVDARGVVGNMCHISCLHMILLCFVM